LALVVLASGVVSMPARSADVVAVRPTLDTGFKLLYSLDFDRAHDFFSAWQRQHPDDPMGHVCEAAGVLFSEFHRLGILEGQFYTNDKAFEARKKQLPDSAAGNRFNAALERAENLARLRITNDPRDRDSLFALTLATGLRADYAALIEKRNLASLHYTKDSTAWAQRLLAVDPQCYDAHLATGISRYIIGSMAAPLRWILRLGGVSGDKAAGIAELRLTADRGQYLAPFARILLAIAYVREKDKTHAREVLASLRDEFPSNPLFAREIARLDSGR
jgi:hypothetical protein